MKPGDGIGYSVSRISLRRKYFLKCKCLTYFPIGISYLHYSSHTSDLCYCHPKKIGEKQEFSKYYFLNKILNFESVKRNQTFD